VVELSDLPVEEQMVHLTRTGVLVGVHGAGLSGMVGAPRPQAAGAGPRPAVLRRHLAASPGRCWRFLRCENASP
jgi:hypothetical protein